MLPSCDPALMPGTLFSHLSSGDDLAPYSGLLGRVTGGHPRKHIAQSLALTGAPFPSSRLPSLPCKTLIFKPVSLSGPQLSICESSPFIYVPALDWEALKDEACV